MAHQSLEDLRKFIDKVSAEPEQECVAHGTFYEQEGKILFIGTESRGISTFIRDAYPGWQTDFGEAT